MNSIPYGSLNLSTKRDLMKKKLFFIEFMQQSLGEHAYMEDDEFDDQWELFWMGVGGIEGRSLKVIRDSHHLPVYVTVRPTDLTLSAIRAYRQIAESPMLSRV